MDKAKKTNGKSRTLKVYRSRTDYNGVKHFDKRRVIATIKTLNDGTKKVTHFGSTWKIHTDGTIESDVKASVSLEPSDNGEWIVRLEMEPTLFGVLKMLYGKTGTLARDIICGIPCEGLVESDPLTDEDLEGVRSYFWPECLNDAR